MMQRDSDPIYLDGFATMPVAPEALTAMEAAWRLGGNAGSGHLAGERAAQTVALGRAAVAMLIGAAPSEIVFTSGATEANNLALLGVAANAPAERRRIIVSAIEHKSVLAPAETLATRGFAISVAPVDRYGRIDLRALETLLADDVLLVSVMAANNETGVIQPIAEIASLAHAVGAIMHSDAAQAFGKIPIDVIDWDVDLLSLSGHKCYGPMGIGALYAAAGGIAPAPLFFGGGQQGGIRPGTEPVPLIAGFGAAAEALSNTVRQDAAHGREMIDRFITGLDERQIRYVAVTGDQAVLPGSLAIRLVGVDAESLCMAMGQSLCISTGSACTHGQLRTSHVLDSMGYSEEGAREVIRIFAPRSTTIIDIDRAVNIVAETINRLR